MTRRRRRILKGAMWGCVACAVIFGVVSAWSNCYGLEWSYSGPTRWVGVLLCKGDLGAGSGAHYSEARTPATTTAYIGILKGHTWVYPWRSDRTFRGIVLDLPLWLLSAASLAAAFLFFRLSRVSIPGLCPRCGYDLAGSPTGVCPECGTVGESKGVA